MEIKNVKNWQYVEELSDQEAEAVSGGMTIALLSLPELVLSPGINGIPSYGTSGCNPGHDGHGGGGPHG